MKYLRNERGKGERKGETHPREGAGCIQWDSVGMDSGLRGCVGGGEGGRGGARGVGGGGLHRNHSLALALICFVSLPLWASVFAELSSDSQVIF